MVVIIIIYLPAGTVRRIIKNIWWKVGLRLPVQDQVLQRLHPADLLAVQVQPRGAVLRDPLPGARPGPVPPPGRAVELCNTRPVTSGLPSPPSPLTFRVQLGLGRRHQVEPREAVRRHQVGSEAASPAGAAVPGVQAAALTVPALSLSSGGVERTLGGSPASSSSSSSSSALTAGLARPDPHHLARLDHLLWSAMSCVRLEIEVRSLEPNLSNCCGRAGLCKH